MIDDRNKSGLPSRTSILVAAARAFGSREPDESVRNPDTLAALLTGPAELALISDHPLSQMLALDYSAASETPEIVGLAWLMLLRTRFIDEALERAVKSGVTQIVILGAGFDTRAYRFRELLEHCKVVEIDAPLTQQYKKLRIERASIEVPPNLTYASVDFAEDKLTDVLRQTGIREEEKTFYIWEGVSMYLPEESVRQTLRTIASRSAPGSSLVLDYANRVGIELVKESPIGVTAIARAWGEPWIFGVPSADGRDFFSELGFDPGTPVATTNPDIIKRYTMRQSGTVYGAQVFEKMRTEAKARAEAAASAGSQQENAAAKANLAAAAAGGVYWLAELTVPERRSS